MRKLLLFMPILMVFGCQQKASFKISGTIENPTSDFVLLYSPGQEKTDTLFFNKGEGQFESKIPLENGYFMTLKHGKSRISLYVEPGNEQHITFNAKDLENNENSSLSITGEGSANSNLLAELKEIKIEEGMRTLLSFPAPKFDSIAQGNYISKMELIERFKKENNPSATFVEKISLIQRLEMISNYNYFTYYHPMLAPDDTTSIPAEFNEMGKDIALDNEAYFKELSSYRNHVLYAHESTLEQQLEELGAEAETPEYYSKKFDAINSLDVTQRIKDELANTIVNNYSFSSDSVKQVIRNKYQEVLKNEKYIKLFKETLAKLDALKPGALAPTFSYKDKDGNLVSSADLKGKVIYIDIWATWCGPCKREIPSLKTLEHELHNKDVAFVSISVDTDKEAWEKMIVEKEMGGYQLHAPEAWESSIIKDYVVKGIPHFVMIDKEGKLIDANATRPSNPETKKTILNAIKS